MDNLRGILLMICGQASFAVADLFTKLAVAKVPLPEVVLVSALGGLAIYLPLTLMARQPLLTRAALSTPVLVRSAAQVVAMVAITSGLALSDLSTATALMQTGPIVAMLGAWVFLGEQVGWRRWTSVAIGLLGVLVILRPQAGLEPGLIFILVGVVALATRDIATRRSNLSIPSLALTVYSFAAVVPVAALWLAIDASAVIPDAEGAWLLLAVTLSVALGFLLMTVALRKGEVSAIIPFRYSRLVVSLMLAIVVLGERPDLWVFVGAAMIIASGLYALLRERALAAR